MIDGGNDVEKTGSDPYLGFVTKADEMGLDITRVKVGNMLVISDGKEEIMFAISKISIKGIEGVCVCRQPNCNLKLRFRTERHGNHPARFRLGASAKNAPSQ